jgi:hypothetical protein
MNVYVDNLVDNVDKLAVGLQMHQWINMVTSFWTKECI